jgi:hypothetical protein
MVQGKESRDLPTVLDAASHRQLLASCSSAIVGTPLT